MGSWPVPVWPLVTGWLSQSHTSEARALDTPAVLSVYLSGSCFTDEEKGGSGGLRQGPSSVWTPQPSARRGHGPHPPNPGEQSQRGSGLSKSPLLSSQEGTDSQQAPAGHFALSTAKSWTASGPFPPGMLWESGTCGQPPEPCPHLLPSALSASGCAESRTPAPAQGLTCQCGGGFCSLLFCVVVGALCMGALALSYILTPSPILNVEIWGVA